MAFDPDRLRALRFPAVEQTLTEKDCILYALGVGYGNDPVDGEQLPFVHEQDGRGLRATPTMASLLGYPGFWYRDLDTGLDAARVVHAAERIELDGPLPTSGRLRSEGGVTAVIDKGAARGALVVSERRITDTATGRRLATVTQTALCRGDGGFDPDGPATSPPRPAPPGRPPDAALTLPTQPQAALIFRLSGDINPLHADPAAARAAGFERPILHGLATYGLVGHALVRLAYDGQPERLRGMEAHFTAPVLPGESVRTEIWRDGDRTRFRALVGERVVIDHGRAWGVGGWGAA
ncbi:MaoC/PaaZ C-terminal domain-containing protein [Azospirillum agricola]|uniref:MaoC/PaaZ C-terminal domain-containing protein n=1 Tax=Azospirillum agricola TaxID=1720247 RepID=UPI000A0F38AD|nr:MaoC/PaaZ C-terminal domain-containing protein [Azospirillum agricola]SMH48485.1 Acyl dehydratase [Azospirillum lipoferum]